MKKYLHTLLFTSTALMALPALAEDASYTLAPVVVEATEAGGGTLTVPDNVTARKEIERTAGAVAVVDAEDYKDTYSVNFEDTLAYQAGVYAQKRFGEEVRVSMRGSGLSRGFHLRGITLLQDGIPFNLADGAGDFQEADSLATQRIEVYKGANALQYGSTTLGGAINMVSKTGISDTGDELRAEVGSFNTKRLHVQSGRAWGDSDVFLSLTGTDSNGFRTHDDQSNLKFNGNFGTALADDVETRFYLSGNVIDQELPGSVSKRTALSNPKAADPSAIRTDWKRDIRSVRLTNKTTFDMGGGDKVDAGAFVNVKDLFHPITPFVGVVDQESVDYGAFAQGSGEYTLSDHRNTYRVGLTTHAGDVRAKLFRNVGGSRGALIADADQSAQNATLYGENQFYVVPEWALVTGAQLGVSRRKVDDNLTPAESDSETYRSFNPKVGVLYEPNKDLQFFANVSKSHEPPTFSELTQGGTVGFTPVDAQKAWTAEVGSRGAYGIAAWDVSLYRAWIRDEMLQFTTGAGIPASTFNAGDTVHQGAELGLDVALASDVFTHGDSLQWRGAYTFSDYNFNNDPQYNNNIIAGQPKHFLQAELRYDHSGGWYIAPNIELAGDAEVDFANTLETSGYGVVGLGAGYDITSNISLFVDGRNLLDKRYISTYSTLVNSTGNTDAFYPADGRSVYGGVRIKL
jgi:iron complex outermembrane recepter protein